MRAGNGWAAVGLRGLVAAALVAGLAGCGRTKTVIFGSASLPLATQLSKAVKDKNSSRVADLVVRAEKIAGGSGKVAADEVACFKTVKELCDSAQWDKAAEYIDRCVRESTEAAKP